MILQRGQVGSGRDADVGAPGPSDTIDGWLSVLDRILRLPEHERGLIRAELEAHLRERARDLVLGGAAEPEAVRTAIHELGHATALARRLEHAHRSTRRRLLMNLSILGLAATAAVAGLLALSPGARPAAGPEPAVMPQPSPTGTAAYEILRTTRIALEPDAVLDELVAAIRSQGLSVAVEWESLERIELYRDTPLGISAPGISLQTVFTLLQERTGTGGDAFDWRIRDEVIRLDRRDGFDAREGVLVNHRIDGVRRVMEERYGYDPERASEEIGDVIRDLVAPEDWQCNGGELAQMRIVGGSMFVHAVPRVHTQVQWILAELADTPGAAGPAGGAR